VLGLSRLESFTPPAIERLGETLAPTLVMVGELDTPDFQGIAQTIERGVPQARRISLPGVGHLANLEDPERFNDILLRFLDSTLSGGEIQC
jgi:3-oxoadipate enol-lactonase